MNFAEIFSGLRRAYGYSQRKVAADLEISQALLSHYENGLREPGLAFIEKACRYYSVSADYMLGMSEKPESTKQTDESMAGLSKQDKDQLTDCTERILAAAAERGGEEAAEAVRQCLEAAQLELLGELGGENELLTAQTARAVALRRLRSVLNDGDADRDERIEEYLTLLRDKAEKTIQMR